MTPPPPRASPPPTLLAIATTGGPAVVRAFWFDAEAARSQIVRFDESHIPMGVDAQFAGFDALLRRRLRAMGVAIPADPLILEVEGDVDAGSSWQLGLAAAHLLAAAGALTFDAAQARRRVLATGRLGTAVWDAKPVEGLDDKLARAAAFLTPAPDCAAVFLLPETMAAAAAQGAPPGARATGVATLDALATALGTAPAAPAAAKSSAPATRRAAALAAAALLAAAAALALRPDETERPPAPPAPPEARLAAASPPLSATTAVGAPPAEAASGRVPVETTSPTPDAAEEPSESPPPPPPPPPRDPPPESALSASVVSYDGPAGCRGPELAASFGAPPPARRETPLPSGARSARDAFDAPLCAALFRAAPHQGAEVALAVDVDPPDAARLRADGPSGPVEAVFAAAPGLTVYVSVLLRWAEDPADSPSTRRIRFEFRF